MSSQTNADIRARAETLFQKSMNANYAVTNKWCAGLFVAQWVGGIVAALCLSPVTWNGPNWTVHPHVWQALTLGTLTAAFPLIMIRRFPTMTATRHVIAVAQMLASALLIHISGGRIETHFHVFGSLAILSFYRDWRVLISATLITATDHLLRGLFLPQSVYGVTMASPWRTLEHASWVIFEDIFLIGACLRSTTEMHALASQQAELEATNEIIEAKVAEQLVQIRRNESRTQLMLDTTGDAILTATPEGVIKSANPAAAGLFALSQEELLKKTIDQLVALEDRDGSLTKFKGYAENYVNSNGDINRQFNVTTGAGEVVPVQLTVNAMDLESEKLYCLIARNISDRRRIEKQLNSILSVVSERVSPQLAIVRSALQLIRPNAEEERAATAEQVLAIGNQAAWRTSQLVQDLADLQNITAGHIQLHRQGCLARKIIDTAVAELQQLASEARVTIDVTCPNMLAVMGDERRLIEIVTKLLANAIKFTTRGDTIKLVASPATNNVVRFLVADHGPGVAPTKTATLFAEENSFERVGNEKGGVGLLICKGLVEKLGGQIGFTSNVGSGSSFWFEVPASTEKISAIKKQKLALMCVNKIQLTESVKQLLQQEQYQFVHAVSLADAAQLLAESTPSVAVIDLGLPNGEGLGLVEYIRQSGHQSDVPIILIGSSKLALESHELDYGWLSSPLDPHQLVKTMDELITVTPSKASVN